MRPAVDDVQQRVALLRVEAGRVAQPHLHLVAERAAEPPLLVATEGHAGEHAVVEGLDAARLLARQMGVQPRRMIGGVGQRHQRAGALVEGADRAAAHHQLGAPVGQVEAPQVLAALLLGREEQRLAVVLPQQRGIELMVPLAAFHRPAAALALPHAQLRRHGVLAALVAGQEGDALAVRAVARRAHVPAGIARQFAHAAALELDLGQREAVAGQLFGRAVEGEDDALAVGRDVEGVAVGVAAHQFVGACPRTGRAPGREAMSITSRCGTRPIGRWLSQWRYCAWLVT